MHRHNPINSPEQREHERLALHYFQHPEIQAEMQAVRRYWLNLAQPSEDMRACFEWAFEEVMFAAVVWALNQDPLYPKVITITRVEHQLDGKRIPGTRWGIDNPDSVYRVIPVSVKERYVIHGKVPEPRLLENYFTLWDPEMQTVGLLSGNDLVIDGEGCFEISVDADPANGRSNHIQLPDEAHEFYIRDVIHDWTNDRPNELRVERLGAAPTREPWDERHNLDLIKAYMYRWAENTTRWNSFPMDKPANEFSFTIDRDSDGALRNQIYVLGNFVLPDAGTALVLNVNMGGARYFIAPITTIWGTSNEIMHRNGSLNNHQARPNADDTYTFVLSLEDPGVYNWLDPNGLTEGILTLRWAEFDDGRPNDVFGVTSRLVALSELQDALPSGTEILTQQQRALQLADRAESYAWRIAEQGGVA